MADKGIKGLEKISGIRGIREIILVHGSRVITSPRTKGAGEKARALLSCRRHAEQISETGVQYLLFSRENQAHLLVFPLGPYTLGVTQEKGVDSLRLAKAIQAALTECEFTIDQGAIHDS